MSTLTFEAPASHRTTRRQVNHVNGHNRQSADLEITGTPDTEIGGNQLALARKPANVACRQRCKASRKQQQTEAAILAWEAASEAASRLYGEMNEIEEQIMNAMLKAGLKSLRLSDGRMLVVLDYAKDPCHPTGIYADYIQVLPADVIPE